MQFQLRKHWRELRSGRPGERFTARYERAQRGKNRKGAIWRVVLLVAAILCIAIGIVLAVMPGPAFVFFFLAGGILATESRAIARFMDGTEVFVRRVVSWLHRCWQRLPATARVFLVFSVTVFVVAVVFVGYRFLRS